MVTLVRRAGRGACRRTATIASATARPRRSSRSLRSSLISISAVGDRVASDRSAAQRRQHTADAEYGIAVSLVAIVGTFALGRLSALGHPPTGSVAIQTDNVHYQSDLMLNVSVIVALVLDQYALRLRRRCLVRHRHRFVADVGRVARIGRSGQSADGPRMARGEAPALPRRRRRISGARGPARSADPQQRHASFRPVPRLGPGRLDGAEGA